MEPVLNRGVRSLSSLLLLSLAVSKSSAFTVPLTTRAPFENATTEQAAEHHSGIHLAGWNFDYVSEPLILSLFVLLTGLVKIVCHHIRFISNNIPESCILVVIGVGFGALIYYTTDTFHDIVLSTRSFMLFLLPPIVLEASYSLNNRAFADNLGTILLYAVMGTIVNFLIIGFSLWGLAVGNLLGPSAEGITMIECLLFGSIIVAVDPVAVLAIFQEIHVNATLYFLVFGESLLNDAVTIVISNMMKAFAETPDIQTDEIIIGIFSFFTVSLGGLSIGLLFGIATALITRITSQVRVVEPLAILVMAYLSYLCAELVHWSGIISMVGCGIVQAQYAFHNISKKSSTTVVYFMKMLSNACESVVFLFLGLGLFATKHQWDTGFVLWSVLLCLVARVVGVFGLTFLVNLRNKVKPITLKEQFIMWYGGLRGGIAFAVCITISDSMAYKNMFLTTTYIIIIFTVFVQGITIRPVVKYCHIKKEDDSEEPLLVTIQKQVADMTLSLVEVMIGQRGQNYVRAWVYNFNDKYMKRFLQRRPETQEVKLIELYEQAAIEYYKANVLQGAIEVPSKVGLKQSNEIEVNMEEILVREIQRERKASYASDATAGELRRIISRSTMWLYDRNLTHEAEAEETTAAKAAVRRYRSRGQTFTSSQHFDPADDDDYGKTIGANLKHTLSVISLGEADRRMIRPSLGHRLQVPSNVNHVSSNEKIDSTRRPRTHSLQEPSRDHPDSSSEDVTTAAAAAATRRYLPRIAIQLAPLGRPSSQKLTTVGEEEPKTPNDSSKAHAQSGGYVNRALVPNGTTCVPVNFDEETFGDFVDQIDPPPTHL